MLGDFAFPSSQPLPALGLVPSFDDFYDAPKFGHRGGMGAAELLAFCEDFLSGQLRPSFKSAPIPTERWQPGASSAGFVVPMQAWRAPH